MISYQNSYRYKLTVILQKTNDLFSAALLETGITPKHYGTLLAVKQYPNITQKDLADKLEFDRSSMGKFIDLLEEMSYLKRNKHPTDRRAYCLTLTEEGNSIVSKLWLVMEESENKALSNLTPEEVETFSRLIDKIVEKKKQKK